MDLNPTLAQFRILKLEQMTNVLSLIFDLQFSNFAAGTYSLLPLYGPIYLFDTSRSWKFTVNLIIKGRQLTKDYSIMIVKSTLQKICRYYDACENMQSFVIYPNNYQHITLPIVSLSYYVLLWFCPGDWLWFLIVTVACMPIDNGRYLNWHNTPFRIHF